MKQPLLSGYTFDPQNGVLDFSGTLGFDVRRLFVVTNLLTGDLLYAVSVPGRGFSSQSGSVLTLDFPTVGMAPNDPLFVLYEDGQEPLPNGAATEVTLEAVLATLQAQRAETLWTDNTGAFFIRIDVRGSISWTDPVGNSSVGPGAGARPAGGASMLVDSTRYQAVAAGTGGTVRNFVWGRP